MNNTILIGDCISAWKSVRHTRFCSSALDSHITYAVASSTPTNSAVLTMSHISRFTRASSRARYASSARVERWNGRLRSERPRRVRITAWWEWCGKVTLPHGMMHLLRDAAASSSSFGGFRRRRAMRRANKIIFAAKEIFTRRRDTCKYMYPYIHVI